MEEIKNFLYRNRWIVTRTFLIFFIALLANTYLIPDLKINPNDVEKIIESNQTYLETGSFDLNQNDLNSGNFNTILWKIIYLGSGKDRICFEKYNQSNNQEFYGSYNGGEFFNIINKRCFDISRSENKITFDTNYIIKFSLPEIYLPRVVNKSECVFGIDEITHTCITQDGLNKAVTQSFQLDGTVYLESNNFHKIVKFIFIFFSTGTILWAWSRTFKIIKDGFLK